ncbi:MAG: NB-ARC domain-containing protein, partial [Acidobacteriota bacterium]|nr:NB-ARC domain-containing protein [Acidobacteriota bacterium]
PQSANVTAPSSGLEILPDEDKPDRLADISPSSDKRPDSTSEPQPIRKILDERLPPLSDFLYAIHGQSAASHDQSPALWLLPSGWRGGSNFAAYAKAVQAFDWDEFYTAYQGEEFFNWMHDQLLEIADAVFIDSRTGVTEMGVCARQLADVVVSFCAPNAQNFDGTTRMMDSFQRPDVIEARGHRGLYSLAVPARVEMHSDQRLRNDFRLRFRSAFERRKDLPPIFQDTLKPSLWDLKIPYVSAFAFEEKLVIGQTDRVSGLGGLEELEDAYNKLANHLAVLASEGSAIRKQFASRLEQEFPALLPQVAISYLQSDGKPEGGVLRDLLEREQISLWPDLEHGPEMPEERCLQIVRQTRNLVVVITPDAFESQVLRRELRYARQQGKCIYLVTAGKQDGEPSLPLWMQNLPIYDLLSNPSPLLNQLKSPSQASRAPVIAPPNLQSYVDRPVEFADLKSQLLTAAQASSASSSPSFFAIWGPAGSGKSAFAARICQDEDVLDSYPAGVLWVKVGERPDLVGELSGLFQALTDDPPPVLESSSTQVPQLVQALNLKLTGRNILLVFDDVWDRSHLDELAKLGDRGARLITTRDLAIAAGFSSRTVTIKGLTDEQAVKLLGNRTAFDGAGKAQLQEMAALLQNNPLALTLVSSALQRATALGQSPQAALETVSERVHRDVMSFDRLDGAGRNDAIAISINASWERLAASQQERFLQLAHNFESREFTLATDALVQRFCELTLLETSQTGVFVPPLILAFLKAQGFIQEKHNLETKPRRIRSSEDKQKHDADLTRARAVLGGQQASADELKQIARSLQRLEYFGYARQLWARARRLPESQKDPERIELAQKQAVCTYKDQDLPSAQRYSRALEILSEVDNLATTTSQETLGLAGAIYKYKWMSDGQLQDLERSAAYYGRGYAIGATKDNGYTGINAAFVLDLLADQESRQAVQAGLASPSADTRRERARTIREDILAAMAPLAADADAKFANDWWVVVTVAEAYFGLQRYDPARRWLKHAVELEYEEWQLQTTARQLGWIAY